MTRSADVRLAVEVGARYVGMIFTTSARKMTPDRAVAALAPSRGSGVRAVGVFGLESDDEILATAERVGLDCLQLHGSHGTDRLRQLRATFGGEVWGVARVEGGRLPAVARHLFAEADGVVLDTLSSIGLGGTGEPFDWPGAAADLEAFARRARLIIAGGLRADNVAKAISVLSPDVVDVSSGVESAPGIKDPERMRAFMEAVRESATR
jgi:phosphoribosylanthranilate isomerase